MNTFYFNNVNRNLLLPDPEDVESVWQTLQLNTVSFIFRKFL